ncbi:MAG: biotin/lipoyl-containing protein [Acidobacteriota bacterium]|nr:biotin/lipoyl-containing protein [Acidobacteriota bacterium]
MQRLFLEREDANSESATLVAWLVADGETVQRHQRICVLETTKATIDMVAPQPGILRHRYPEGSEIAFGTTLGWILEAGEDSPDPEDTRETGGAAETAGLQISRAAARLIEEAGIDPTAIREHGFITEKEVRRHMARSRRQAAPPHPALADIDLEAVSLPPGLGQDDHGRLDPVFLSRLREEGERFRRLHPGEKLQAYRKHGAAIAEDVHLGPGSLLIAPRLVIGPGSRIGAETTADCAEQLAIGALSHFGPGLTVRARCAVFGDNVHAGRGITIGGGGHRDPWAVFAAGNLTFIGDEVFINVCRAVLLGREVFLTMRSIIVTHNIGHSPLEGFENRFAPVILEDRCQVGMGCTLYAGVRIGREAIVGSGSYVLAPVPAGKLAMGVPARVVAEARRPVSAARRRELAREMVEEFGRLLAARGERVERIDGGGGLRIRREGRLHELLYADRADQLPPGDPASDKVYVVLEGSDASPGDGLLLELLPRRARGQATAFGESVREYFRKRGIRFEPGPWRYSGGWL